MNEWEGSGGETQPSMLLSRSTKKQNTERQTQAAVNQVPDVVVDGCTALVLTFL